MLTAHEKSSIQQAIWIPVVVLLALPALALYGLWENRAPSATRAIPYSVERAEETLSRLVGDNPRPHPVGSVANAEIRSRLIAELRDLGLNAVIQSRFICGMYRHYCGTVHNVMARMDGQADGQAVLMASHYDTVPASPGTSDPMAGVAAVLEVARALSEEGHPGTPVILLFPDGEEAGLLGSQAFVNHHPWARDVGAVVNLEARGTAGPSSIAYTANGNYSFLRAFGNSSSQAFGSSLITSLATQLPNLTDQAVYQTLGVPAVDFGFVRNFRLYHSATDSTGNLDRDSLAHHIDNLFHSVQGAVEIVNERGAAVDAAFFTIGGHLWSFPASYWLPMTALSMVLFIVWARRLGRTEPFRMKALAWPSLLVPIALIVALVAGVAYSALRESLDPIASNWPAYPTPLIISLWLFAAGAMLLPLALMVRRCRPREAGLAFLGWWIVLGLACGLLMPAVAYLFLLPILIALITGILTTIFSSDADRSATAALLAGGAAGGILWFPNLWFLRDLVGLAATPVTATMAAVAMFPLLICVSPCLSRIWTPVAVLTIGAILLVTGTQLPAFTPGAPQFLNLIYYLDAKADQAEWVATGSPLPASLRTTADFERWSRNPEWLPAEQGPAAQAPVFPIAAPELEARIRPGGDGDRVRLIGTLRSSRGAPMLRLIIKGKAPAQVKLNGAEVPRDEAPYRLFGSRWNVYSLWTASIEGIPVEITLEPDSGSEIVVVDRSFDLPRDGSRLIEARPDNAAPNGLGDSTVVVTRYSLRDFDPAEH